MFDKSRTLQFLDVANDVSAEGMAVNNSSRELDIRLVPHAELVGQRNVRVSFGLPLPPGTVVSTADISFAQVVQVKKSLRTLRP